MPYFSGIVKYENNFFLEEIPKDLQLKITEAHEGVEVFINNKSLGIQIAPPFNYEISSFVIQGINNVRIEVATTLEREISQYPDRRGQLPIATSESGITGEVLLAFNE